MKSLCYITAYATTKEKQDLLLRCIKSMRLLENDVMVVSHAPLPEHIINEIDYYVYDKENRFNKISGTIVWKQINNIRIERYIGHAHQFPITRLIRSAFHVARAHGYEFVWGTDFDCVYSEADIQKLKDLKHRMVEENKKFILFHPKDAAWKLDDDIITGQFYDLYIMAGYVDAWIDVFDTYFPKTVEEFDKLVLVDKIDSPQCFEHYVFDALVNNHHNVLTIDGYIRDYLSSSEINVSALQPASAIILPSNDGYDYLYIYYDEPAICSCKVYINNMLSLECDVSGKTLEDNIKLIRLDMDCEVRVDVYQHGDLIHKYNFEYSKSAADQYKTLGKIIFQ